MKDPARLRWLLVAFAVVATAFISASLLAQLTASAIDDEVQQVVGNALPSMEHLTAARTALRHLEVASDAYAEGPHGSRAVNLDRIHRAIQKADGELAAYRALPSFEGEKALYEELAPDREALAEAVARLEGEMAVDDVATARDAADHDVRGAIDRLDESVGRLVEFNAEHAAASAEAAGTIRRRSMVIGFSLDALCAVLAAGAAMIVLRGLRRYVALASAHASLLAARADELEVFANRVAHDLVSPLSSLAFCLAFVKRSAPDTPPTRDALSRANACVKRSQDMVRAIFDFARSGARPLRGARADVGLVAADVLEEGRDGERESPPTFVFEPLEGATVACDQGVLTSILTNLVSNAVKHTRESAARTIVVRAKDAGTRVRIEVEDDGPGLPVGLEALVFEPYVRAPNATQQGLGLGLATVKRLVEAHGGEVGVTSTPGKGCCFWVELPRAEAPEKAASESPPAAERMLH